MNSKMIVYTIFAIVVGYLLTSTAPANIIPKEEEVMFTEKEAPSMEAGADSSMRSADEPLPPEASVLDDAFNYGLLIFDLFIALGIYFIAKRRFP
jgi:hypothetical protein